MHFSPVESSVPEKKSIDTSITGTGANDPVLTVGQGVAVRRVAVGVYRYTFTEFWPLLIGAPCQLGADVPSQLNRFTVVRDTYDPVSQTIDIMIFNAGGVGADLTALQYLDVEFKFSTSGAVLT